MWLVSAFSEGSLLLKILKTVTRMMMARRNRMRPFFGTRNGVLKNPDPLPRFPRSTRFIMGDSGRIVRRSLMVEK
jgi:hypothetical protein